ncbi:MAG TPA: Cys-tRNA(Pro) deacylase [Tissierellaceae bacterium]
MSKTNAMRILDGKKIKYEMLEYDISDDKVDGISVAKKINTPLNQVYKTLVAHGSEDIYVFVIPVDKELNLKKAAKVVKEKKIELVRVDEIEKLTGYIRGGCSPVGMKKKYKTFIQEDCLNHEKIVVSGGKIGSQIKINPKDLIKVVNAKTVDIIE